MKKPLLKSGVLLIMLFALTHVNVQAQFEQKLTLQVSAGTASLLDIDDVFDRGAMFNAGVQYNFSRRFGMTAMVMYGMHFSNPDIFDLDATFYTLGLGLSAKYKFFHTRRVNPYLLFGLSGSFLSFEIQFPGSDWPPERIEEPVAFGIIMATGLEFNLSENFALFLQFGYNEIYPSEGTNYAFGETYALLGINLNIFKSRTL